MRCGGWSRGKRRRFPIKEFLSGQPEAKAVQTAHIRCARGNLEFDCKHGFSSNDFRGSSIVDAADVVQVRECFDGRSLQTNARTRPEVRRIPNCSGQVEVGKALTVLLRAPEPAAVKSSYEGVFA